MSRTDSYRHGLELGRDYAIRDDLDDMPLASGADELRIEAWEARDDAPTWRAFKLGVVRGYRDAVRTFERGRWGT